jgi:hypothetical protein
MEAKIEANNEKFEVFRDILRLPDGYPRSRDKGHSRRNKKSRWMAIRKGLKPIRALEDRYGARHLVTGRCLQPKKRTQGNGGSQKNLAAARRQMTLRTFRAYARDTVSRDEARTILYTEPLKDGRLRRDVRHDLNATVI